MRAERIPLPATVQGKRLAVSGLRTDAKRSTKAGRGGNVALLPHQVENLPAREREVAIILYQRGAMTGKAIHDLLPRELSYSALRSMLMRLCRKRVLHRRKVTGSHDPRDRRIPYLYVPAITEDLVRSRALSQLAQDYFDGSLNLVLCAVAEALKSQSQFETAGTADAAE